MLRKRSLFLLVFSTLFLVLLISQHVGLFRLSDILLADIQSRMSPYRAHSAEVVLIEERRQSSLTSVELNKQIALLVALGPRRVVLLSRREAYRSAISASALEDAAADVLLPIPARTLPGEGLQPLAAGPAETAHSSGSICAPGFEFGYHLLLPIRPAPDAAPCFQQLLAPQAQTNIAGEVNVNFARGDAYLPSFSLSQLQSQAIPRSVVAGKTVLLAPDTVAFGSISMPGNFPAGGISEARWQALALDNILQGQGLREWPIALTGVLLGVLVLGLLLGLQWLSAAAGILLLSGLLAGILVGGWLGLHYGATLVPQSLFIVASGLCLGISSHLRRRWEEASMTKSVDQMRNTLMSRLDAPDFYAADEPWQQIIVFMNQHFSLTRSIFLERIKGDHRLRAIASLNCHIDDIDEKRRDYERTPYSTAIEAGGPIVLEGNFLRKGAADEQQHLVALMLGGEIMGFWAFSAPRDRVLTDAALANIQQFSAEIAELLFHRREWQDSERRERGVLARMLRFEAGLNKHRHLTQMTHLLTKHHRSALGVFNQLSSAALVYDLFGHVVQTNSRLEKLAKSWDMPFYQMTSLDVLTRICGLDQEQARSVMRRVTLRKERMALLATHPAQAAGSLIEIKPILPSDEPDEPDESDEPRDAQTPFSIQGILFEFHTSSRYSQLRTLVQDVYDSARYQIRNHMESAGLAQSILAARLSGAEQKLVSKTIDELQQATAELEKVGPHLARILSHQETRLFPLSLITALKQAQARHENEIHSHRITIENQLPSFLALVWGMPAVLAEILDAILALLLKDASNQSTLTFDLRMESLEGEKRVQLHCSNQGYGVPEERLDAPLLDSAESSELDRLLAYSTTLTEWQGELSVQSELGQGFRVKLEMWSDF